MPQDNLRNITAKFPGCCYECEDLIEEGDPIVYDIVTRKAYCEKCGKDLTE